MSTKFWGDTLEDGSDIALGIDQSLTGFSMTAIDMTDPNKYITWVYKSPLKGVDRLADIRRWMRDILGQLTVTRKCYVRNVAMEGTVVASHSASILGELSAVVRLVLFDFFSDLDCKYPAKIPPMSLKRYVTGKGNSKKQEMLLYVYKKWGITFEDDNAADSYSLSRLASGRADTDIEKSIVEKMQDSLYRD